MAGTMLGDRERPTTLGLALLGLVNAGPRSGYALRMVFENTPIGRFSSSPGSIYPALKKLESMRFIEPRPSTGTGKAFHLTERGRHVLLEWLSRPVTVDEYDREPDVAFLRFAFLDAANDAVLTVRYLESFESAVKESLAGLRAFLRSDEGEALTLLGSLAVQHGVSARKAALRWVRHALDMVAMAGSIQR